MSFKDRAISPNKSKPFEVSFCVDVKCDIAHNKNCIGEYVKYKQVRPKENSSRKKEKSWNEKVKPFNFLMFYSSVWRSVIQPINKIQVILVEVELIQVTFFIFLNNSSIIFILDPGLQSMQFASLQDC